MLDFKTVMKRLPVALMVWLVGAITCGLILNVVLGNASSMSGGDFVLAVTYIPYLFMAVCTVVTVCLSEQSFASLVLSLVFSMVLGIATLIIASGWLADPVIAAALTANSPEGYVVTPMTSRPMTIAVRVLVSFLTPLVSGMVCSWAYKKFFFVPKQKPVEAMSKSEKKAARQAKYNNKR